MKLQSYSLPWTLGVLVAIAVSLEAADCNRNGIEDDAEFVEEEREFLERLLHNAPAAGKVATENMVILWAASMLAFVVCWAVVGWIGRMAFAGQYRLEVSIRAFGPADRRSRDHNTFGVVYGAVAKVAPRLSSAGPH